MIHLCGKGNKPAYKPVNGYFAFEFYDMKVALSACDFCVSRGGSNTLFEILYSAKPSIIVPLKKGSRGDQFNKTGAVLLVDESSLKYTFMYNLERLKSSKQSILRSIKALRLKNGAEMIAQKLANFDKKIAEHMF